MAELLEAITGGDDNEVLRLLRAGADPNARHPDECPDKSFAPLHLACELGKDKVVEYLIAKGVVLDSSCDYDDGWQIVTPLHLAAKTNHANIVRTLLNAGADYSLEDISEHTALDIAAWFESVASLEVLLVPAANNEFHKNQALNTALFHGSVQAVKTLLQAGADPNNMQHQKYTTLQCAIINKNYVEEDKGAAVLELIDLLLTAGADIEAAGPSGMQPLAFAASFKASSSVILTLVAAGADINAKDSLGQTALHHAIKECDFGNIQILLNAGARSQLAWTFKLKEASNNSGFSALHLLSRVKDDTEIESINKTLNLLIAAGADLNARSNAMTTPLHEACTSIDPWLRKSFGITAVIQLLIKAGADVKTVDCKGNTPLHYFCKTMNYKARDWNPFNIKNKEGRKLANELTRWPETIAKSLIDAGVDTEWRNADGHTALHVMMTMYDNDRRYIARSSTLIHPMLVFLISAGCRSWDAVPTPCHGIERALFPVWKKHPEDLHCLMACLNTDLKPVLRTFLTCLHHHLPGHSELQIKILAMGLDGYTNDA